MAVSKLRSLRQILAWTQEELGDRSGLDTRTIRRIERENRASLSSKRLLATALGVPVEELADLGTVTEDGDVGRETVCTTYCAALAQSLGPRTEPFIRLRTLEDRDLVDELVELANAGHPGCVVGPSGSGKSYSLMAFVRILAERGHVPVFARGRLFAGVLEPWLDQAVSVYGATSFADLVSSSRGLGAKLVVVADGLNECNADLFEIALENLQGLGLREGAGILVSTQVAPARWVGAIKFKVLHLAAPSAEEKAHLATALGTDLDTRSSALLSILRTPMDVTLASEAWGELRGSSTRFSLLSGFARERLRMVSNPSLCHRALRCVAYGLTEHVSRTTLEEEFSRILEREAYPGAVAQILRTGICTLEHGRVAFSHDLLQDYFAAEYLLFAHSNVETLGSTLDRPTHSALAELVLQAQTDTRRVLELVERSTAARELAVSAAVGELGSVAQEALLVELRTVVAAAIDALEETTVQSEGGFPRVDQPRQWTTFETEMFKVLGACCRVAIPRRLLLELLDAVDKWLLHKGRSVSVRSALYEVLCHMSAGTPVSIALLYADNHTHTIVPARNVDAFDRPDVDPVDAPCKTMLWCFLTRARLRSYWMSNSIPEEVQDELVALVGWLANSGVKRLACEAFELADDFSSSLRSQARKRMKDILSSVESHDPITGTMLIDALDAYGLLEPVYDEDVLSADIARLLSSPEDPDAQARAYGIFAAQLEPASIIHGPHITAVSTLSDGDGAVFHAMAVLGAPERDGASDAAIALRQLRGQLAARKLPIAHRAIERWANHPPAFGFMPQEDVHAFVEAQRCILELGLPEPTVEAADHTTTTWLALGTIIREALVPIGRPNAEASWRILQNELLVHAVMPVVRLLELEQYRRVTGLRKASRPQLANFLRKALACPGVTTLDERGSVRKTARESLIDALGELGDLSDVERLREFVDDTVVGAAAVAAIRRLHEAKHQ